MLNNSQENEYSTKQEDKASDSKLSKGSSSSRSQWSGLKDPRVVRVSRSFGGKDRHSKVCTIRGLRDRRVRLSVPTAIQLYDLQDRLGLNQPSKVVDWLLNVAKDEIDELPPLPISPENFTHYAHSMKHSLDQVSGYQSSVASLVEEDLSHSLSHKDGFKINDNIPEEEDQAPKSTFWNLNAPLRSEETAREDISDKSNWFKRNEPENQGSFHVLPHNILHRPTNSPSFSGLLNNMMPYNSYQHWDPSSLSLSQFGSHGFSVHTEDPHNSYMLCSSGTAPSFFSPYVATQIDPNQRQISHLQMLNSTTQTLMANSLTPNAYPLSQPVVRPLQLGLGPNFLSPQNQNADQLNKGSSTGPCFPNDPKSTFE